MLVSASCFTANVLSIRLLGQVHAVNVWLMACTRFIVGLLIVMTLHRRDFAPLHLFTRGKLIARGLVGGTSVYVYYVTIVALGAGRATFINNTYVAMAGLMAVFILHERFRFNLAFGAVAALTGLGFLTDTFSTAHAPGIYDGLGVLAAIGSAYVVVTIRQLHVTEHSSTIFAAQCVYGLIICGIPALLHLEPITPAALGIMVAASIFSGFGQLTMTQAFRDLPVAEGSLLQMLVPLGIAIGGTVFFHEHFTNLELFGAALILAGTALAAVRMEEKTG